MRVIKGKVKVKSKEFIKFGYYINGCKQFEKAISIKEVFTQICDLKDERFELKFINENNLNIIFGFEKKDKNTLRQALFIIKR